MPGTRKTKQNTRPFQQYRGSIWATATALSLLLPAAGALAFDGQIKFKVVNAKTGEPLPGAVIVIIAGPKDLDNIQFNTASNGLVTTGELDSGERTYKARALVGGISYKEITGKIVVIDDQTVEVEIKLESLGEKEIIIKDKQIRLDVKDAGVYTSRDREQLKFFPNAVGNNQSLSKALRSVPGMVPDSMNRLHPRGEANNGTFYIDGFQLPSFLSGSVSQLLTPDMIESIKVRTGGLGANFGGGSTILDTSLRPAISPGGNPLAPSFEYAFSGEQYNGSSQSFTISRQLGALRPGKDGRLVPNVASRAGFVLSYSRRESDNFLEAPQPQRQLSNNRGRSEALLGKFSYRISRQMEASALLGSSAASTGVANRQGLDASYINRGQGYGFGGYKNATDFPRVNFQDGTSFAASQEILDNKVFQSDNNKFYALQLNRTFSPSLRGVFTVGGAQTAQNTSNNNALNYNKTTGAAYSPLTMPTDYSIEYNPTTGLNFTQNQVQADFTYGNKGMHEWKFGLLSQSLKGNEAYQFVPMSNTAATALLNLNGFIGNSLRVNADNTTWPSMFIRRTGGYSAFYLQDTYVPTERTRFNLGLRVENYEQNQLLVVPGSGRANFDSRRSDSAVSPRINVLYSFPSGILRGLTKGQPSVVRAGYNRIFTAPGIGQGAIGTDQTGGTAPLPVAAQTNDQIDLSLEQQLPGKSLRLSTYSKDLKNAHSWQQMVQGPQAGAYMMLNTGDAKVNGVEALLEFKPRELEPRPGYLAPIATGFSGYIAYAASKAQRQGAAVGGRIPVFYQDWDQQATINLGAGYQLSNGALAALTYYHGSGLRSSVTSVGGGRTPIDQLDLRLRTRSKFINNLHALEFGVENLTDSRNPLNFTPTNPNPSPNFAGTRFQQGRRFVVTLSGKF